MPEIRHAELPDVVVFRRQVHADHRGHVLETYRRSWLADAGIDIDFVQANHSRSRSGVLRGLHYQLGRGQAKLVWVDRGRVLDVIVDLRRGSPTFGRHLTVELDDERHDALYVPPGFAHGFCAVTDPADLTYLATSFFDAATERGLAWDDPDLAIPWPTREPILSDRDGGNPRLRDIPESDLPA